MTNSQLPTISRRKSLVSKREDFREVLRSCLEEAINEEQPLLNRLKTLSEENAKRPNDKELAKVVTNDLGTYFQILAVETGLCLKSNVHKIDQNGAMSLRRHLIDEYQIKNTSALLVVDLAVSAYFRALHSSAVYIGLVIDKEGVVRCSNDQQKINLIKEVSRQTEMAYGQLFSALAHLKETNQQTPRIRVHAKNAFIAQNQQINRYPPNDLGNNSYEQNDR